MASKPLPFNPDLEGRTAVVIGGGASLTRQDCEYAEQSGAVLIGVNNAFQIADVDILYASDHPFIKKHWDALRTIRGLVVTQIHANCKPIDRDCFYVEGQHGTDMRSKRLSFGGNSGFAAVHLASLWGAGQIVLLGFDMGVKDGKRHWFGDHPEGLRQPNNFGSWVSQFNGANCPTPVVNCSRWTALECFPKSTIQEVL